jgi:hypothetical protein
MKEKVSCQGLSQLTDFAPLASALARFGRVGREATNQKVGSSNPPGAPQGTQGRNPGFRPFSCDRWPEYLLPRNFPQARVGTNPRIDNFRLPLTRGPSLSQEWAKPRASDRMQTGLMPARLRKRAICGTVVRSKRCSGLTQIGHEARRHSVDPSASSRTVPQVNRSTQSVLHELSAYRNRFWQINALG